MPLRQPLYHLIALAAGQQGFHEQEAFQNDGHRFKFSGEACGVVDRDAIHGRFLKA